jgi:hypothetical protein
MFAPKVAAPHLDSTRGRTWTAARKRRVLTQVRTRAMRTRSSCIDAKATIPIGGFTAEVRCEAMSGTSQFRLGPFLPNDG